ncbi:MAG: hypothetical protein Q9218_000613 [Villophora microphyllina]
MSFHPTEAQSSTIQSGPESKRQPDEQGLANQGQPLGQHGDGTKVGRSQADISKLHIQSIEANPLLQHTTDPEAYQNSTREGAGPVASDSLAAESSNAGGAFSENRNSEPQSVSGSSSTFNNTDTSGATKLDPAPDAAEREAKEAWREVPDEARGTTGQKYSEGAGNVDFAGSSNPDGTYSGGSSDSKNDSGDSGYTPSGIRGGATPGTDDSTNSAQTESASSNAGEAPGYVSSVKSDPAQTGKPHGKNITEGGFESDDKNNASFNSDIGDENDPGRAAEQQFQNTTQTSAGGKGEQQYKVTGDGQYDALETDQQL